MNCIKQIIKCSLEKPALVFLGILFFDQTFKYVIQERILIMDIHKNYNALFGIPFNQCYLIIFLASIAVFLILNKKKSTLTYSPLTLVSFGLLFGGIISNLIDRLTKGYILDYLAIFDTFSFNLADLGIYSGILILLWKIIKK
ncbi:MAG: signal peptidase II [Minisyncoccia bacterium]